MTTYRRRSDEDPGGVLIGCGCALLAIVLFAAAAAIGWRAGMAFLA